MRGNGPDMLDVLQLGVVGLVVWWLLKGGGAFGTGGTGGQGGQNGSADLKPEDLDKLYNWRDIMPGGARGGIGKATLRNAAPQVLRGVLPNGYGIEPADAEAANAVRLYAAGRIAGTLPV